MCFRPLRGAYFLLSVQKVETDEVEGSRPLLRAYFLYLKRMSTKSVPMVGFRPQLWGYI